MTTTATASKGMERVAPIPVTGKRIATGSALYNEVLEFVYDEAALLDQQKFDDWAKVLAEDISYTAPLRITRQGPDRLNTVVRTTLHFDDDYSSLMGRLERLGTKSAWAEDPPSRTRRLVTNVRVWETAKPNEFETESYLLLSRSRYEHYQLQVLSCVRHDLLRRSGPGAFKLARREIIVDQSVLGMANLAVFL
jgi:3-phenylpropionate/cinnamic acid dioxygenase small subunit